MCFAMDIFRVPLNELKDGPDTPKFQKYLCDKSYTYSESGYTHE